MKVEGDWSRALAISKELVARRGADDIRAAWPEPDGRHACVIFTREGLLWGLRIPLEYHPFEMGMTPDELVWRSFVDIDEPWDPANVDIVQPDEHGVRWLGHFGEEPVPDVGRIYPPAPEEQIYTDPAHRAAWLRAWEESDQIRQRLLEDR